MEPVWRECSDGSERNIQEEIKHAELFLHGYENGQIIVLGCDPTPDEKIITNIKLQIAELQLELISQSFK